MSDGMGDERNYHVQRCAVCGVQAVREPKCGGCGAPGSRREWIDVVPAEQLREAVEGLRTIEGGEPLHRYEWCQAIARQTLAKIGPTYIKGP